MTKVNLRILKSRLMLCLDVGVGAGRVNFSIKDESFILTSF